MEVEGGKVTRNWRRDMWERRRTEKGHHELHGKIFS